MSMLFGAMALAFTVAAGLGQTAVAPTPAELKAGEMFMAQDWAGAAAAYERLVKENPASPQIRFRLGMSLIKLGRHGEAIPHLLAAEKHGTPPVPVALQLVEAYASTNQPELALDQLQRAASMGVGLLPPALQAHPALAPLRATERFKAIATTMDRNQRPCAHDPLYNQLDFWLGEWEVRGVNQPPGVPPASSTITKILNNCVVLESWRAPGSEGQSFNIYDRSKKLWHQTWVDATGGLHEYWGTIKDGNMVYEGTLPPLPGQTSRQQTRMTFFNLGPDRVRQFSERTSDGGETWQVNYDLTYIRKKQ
jgi:tetratricopeptide (TPR) repeat protein